MSCSIDSGENIKTVTKFLLVLTKDSFFIECVVFSYSGKYFTCMNMDAIIILSINNYHKVKIKAIFEDHARLVIQKIRDLCVAHTHTHIRI